MLPCAGLPGGLLAWVALGGLAVFVVNSVVDVILSLAWVRVGQQMVYDLARDLFARLQRRFAPLPQPGRRWRRGPIGGITGDSSGAVHSVVNTIRLRAGPGRC